MFGNIISVLSLITAAGTLLFTIIQWRKLNKKIAMLSDVSRASKILPAWYVERMMQDNWCFGLHTCDGRLIAINKIISIFDDGQWMDALLLTREEAQNFNDFKLITAASDSRRISSIRISCIVAAYDMVDS